MTWKVVCVEEADSGLHYGEPILAYIEHGYGAPDRFVDGIRCSYFKTRTGWYFGAAAVSNERKVPNVGPFETPEAAMAYVRITS